MKADRVVDEDQFEILGDCEFAEEGPKRSRIITKSTQMRLFDGWQFQLEGTFRSLTINQVKQLAENCGARVTHHQQQRLQSESSSSQQIINSDDNHNASNTMIVIIGYETRKKQVESIKVKLKDKRNGNKSEIVRCSWLLDSISCYRIQDTKAYIL